MSLENDQTQPVGIFACQPVFLTVGQPGGFTTLDDFYRFAQGECGFEAVSAPIGTDMFNLKEALKNPSYVDDVDGHLQDLGFKHGLSRLEFHTYGQNVSLHSSRVKRFGFFIEPTTFRSCSEDHIQMEASKYMRQIIDVVAPHPKLQRLVGFFGGKGYAIAQAKWSAWPKYMPEWVMASLVADWEPTLEYAADRNVTLHHEFGHPENDILTGENFVVFHGMLSDKGKKGLGLQVDGSHFANVGVDPIPHIEKAMETGCPITNHYKWGAVVDHRDGSCSPYGGWRPWSTASTSFYTIGTVGSEELVRQFHDINARAHQTQEGGVPIFYEGECVGLPNPKQAMKVGAGNCRALRNGRPLGRLEGFVPSEQPMITRSLEETRKLFRGPGGATFEIDKWSGGPFDACFDSPVKPWELLGVTWNKARQIATILERAGYSEAAKVM